MAERIVLINVPRSDGDSSAWPSTEEGYFPVAFDDKSCINWRHRVGTALAKDGAHYDSTNAYILSEWPSGYKLVRKSRRKSSDSVRPKAFDLYLCGSPSKSKRGAFYHYRSANEFIPHALWLKNDSTGDIHTCKCKACVNEVNQSELATSSHIHSSSLAKGAEKNDGPSRTRTPSSSSVAFFREGDVVWVLLDSPAEGLKEGICIQYWPGRILSQCEPGIFDVELFLSGALVFHSGEILPYGAVHLSAKLLDAINKSLLPHSARLTDTVTISADILFGEPGPRWEDIVRVFDRAFKISKSMNLRFSPMCNDLRLAGKSRLQEHGVTWGIETLLVNDVVRLKTIQDTLDLLPPDCPPRARSTVLFLHICQIAIDLEPDNGPDFEVWISGSLYQLVDWSMVTDVSLKDANPLPPAPSGYEFKMITASIRVPARLVEGRYYHGLMQHDFLSGEPLDALSGAAELEGIIAPSVATAAGKKYCFSRSRMLELASWHTSKTDRVDYQ